MSAQVVKQIKTLEEALELRHLVEKLVEQGYRIGITKGKITKGTNPPAGGTEGTKGVASDKLQRLIAELPEESKAREAFLQDVVERLNQLKPVKLRVAFEPSEETITRVVEWLRPEVGEDSVIDFELEEKVLGGAIVEYQGKYGDFSVMKKLKEYFEKHQPELT